MDKRIIDEAARWHARRNGDAMDWPAFTAWLEASPAHALAYDQIEALDATVDEHRAAIGRQLPPLAANDCQRSILPRWAVGGGGAIAAVLALLLFLQPTSPPLAPEAKDYVAGRHLADVPLAEGVHVILAPASRLRVNGNHLTLHGTGYFEVAHRSDRTLTIHAGDFTINDVGTRFSVGNEPGGVSVAVAEGSLHVTSASLPHTIPLAAGQGFESDTSAGTVRLIDVEPDHVASWREGKLEFDRVPLRRVARDLSRYSGERIALDPALSERPFSGVLAIGPGASPGSQLAAALNLDAVPTGGVLLLRPRRS